MRWPVFAIFAFVFYVLQVSVVNVARLESLGGIMPNLVACLLMYVALFAHRSSVLWACWLMGLLMDLAPPRGDISYFVIGPNALGYVFGGYLVLLLRSMVFRRHIITHGFMTVIFLIASGVVATLLLSIRNFYDPVLASGALNELGRRCGVAVYSGLVALIIGFLLNYTAGLWAFQTLTPRRVASMR